jgi:hypothetical protein
MQLSRLRINLDIIKEKIIMAKQGFAASDRRKVEVLGAAGKTVAVHDCGTVFVVGEDCVAISTPSAAQCGDGWWARFVVGAADTVQCDITLGAGSITLLNVSVDGTAGAVSAPGGQVIRIEHDEGGAGDPAAGDEIEILVANSQFFVRALTGK